MFIKNLYHFEAHFEKNQVKYSLSVFHKNMQIIIRAAGGEKWANRLAPKALLYISVVWELYSALEK